MRLYFNDIALRFMSNLTTVASLGLMVFCAVKMVDYVRSTPEYQELQRVLAEHEQ